MNDLENLIADLTEAMGAITTTIDGSIDQSDLMLMDVPALGVASLAIQERNDLSRGAGIALTKAEASKLAKALLDYATRL
jgi:hypothetical protein